MTAVVNSEFSYEFNRSVRWQKTDRSGNPVEPDEDDATLDPDDPQNGGGSSSDSSTSGSGSEQPSGGNGGGGGGGIDQN